MLQDEARRLDSTGSSATCSTSRLEAGAAQPETTLVSVDDVLEAVGQLGSAASGC
jgi:hypothetical protein